MEFDFVYSPLFWLLLNILVAFGILRLRRSLTESERLSSDLAVEGPFWKLERILSEEVRGEGQREYLRHCIAVFLQLMVERGVIDVKPSSTVREVFLSVGREEAVELLELYESARFGGRRLTDSELQLFRDGLRRMARTLIH